MKLDLEVKELDYVTQVLATRPYGEVHQLMQKIVAQANDPIMQGAAPLPEVPKE